MMSDDSVNDPSTADNWLNDGEPSPLPEDAAMFGRQPAHTPSFDEDQFEEEMEFMRKIPTWMLDY
jgi:hypothetical protein